MDAAFVATSRRQREPQRLPPSKSRWCIRRNTTRARVQCYLDAYRTRGDAPCSAHDYRQALEAAIALKMSARDGHSRIELPLEERGRFLLPHPYRQLGGDVVGWDSIGLPPPSIDF